MQQCYMYSHCELASVDDMNSCGERSEARKIARGNTDSTEAADRSRVHGNQFRQGLPSPAGPIFGP
jgi:hypothetical protein